MMKDMHHYIAEVLKGNLLAEEPPLLVDKDFRAVDRDAYQQYLPELCSFVESEQHAYKRAVARLILERIVPDMPDIRTAECLLSGLSDPDQITRNSLLNHIRLLKFPEEIDLQPIKDLIRNGNTSERVYAMEALRAAPGAEGETYLLDVLRRTHSRWDIESIARILADIGGVFSIPVLMARLEEAHSDTNKEIYTALERIAARLEMPEQIKAQFSDTHFWKVKWQGSKESFVGFMAFIAMMSGNVDDQEAGDQLAEIFREEMVVDISPFETFRELRLCSPDTDIFSAMGTVKDSLESKILLEVALSGTGISESKESQYQDIYFEMMNDYLFTRLRRKIQFADDDY